MTVKGWDETFWVSTPRERNRLLTHRVLRLFDGQIGGNDGKYALGIPNGN